MRSGGGGAHADECCGEVFGEGLLGLRLEFGFLLGEVEDVDGGFAFGVDQGYFDVALVGA